MSCDLATWCRQKKAFVINIRPRQQNMTMEVRDLQLKAKSNSRIDARCGC
jgi:hypothetical protein